MPKISIKLELHKPTLPKQKMYQEMVDINTSFANWLLEQEEVEESSKTFKLFSDRKFPSAISNQTVREVISKKKKQGTKQFKAAWCKINNQNFKVEKVSEMYTVSFPTLEKRIGVPVVTHAYQRKWLEKILSGEVKQGATELFRKKKKWFVAISVTVKENPEEDAIKPSRVMGVDLGLRYLAVACIGTKSLFFRGSECAYIRRKYFAKRKELGKAKKHVEIKKRKNKEARWMTNENHQISRQIVNYAIANGVGVIRLEDLTHIRQTAKRGKKQKVGRYLHSWAFSDLREMIEYKAGLVGIRVEYVNPKYTSQTCKCGYCDKNNRQGLMFKCKECGYTSHADVNAAINIAKAISGLAS